MKMKEFTDTELANEQWRDIDGYDGMYQVSDLGRVRSKKYGSWKVLSTRKNRKGYLRLDLSRDGNRKNASVHRLVAQAFIPNDDDNKTQINHINEDKTDNRAVNLEWCTAQYNITYNDIHHRRRHSKLIRDKIKPLYRQDLSNKQNLELFRANGIECCTETVRLLRKDLGLINNKTKRDEIKDIYDPNLSIDKNIEVFRANGIECCEKTVQRLRKDLGITRKYTKR